MSCNNRVKRKAAIAIGSMADPYEEMDNDATVDPASIDAPSTSTRRKQIGSRQAAKSSAMRKTITRQKRTKVAQATQEGNTVRGRDAYSAFPVVLSSSTAEDQSSTVITADISSIDESAKLLRDEREKVKRMQDDFAKSLRSGLESQILQQLDKGVDFSKFDTSHIEIEFVCEEDGEASTPKTEALGAARQHRCTCDAETVSSRPPSTATLVEFDVSTRDRFHGSLHRSHEKDKISLLSVDRTASRSAHFAVSNSNAEEGEWQPLTTSTSMAPIPDLPSQPETKQNMEHASGWSESESEVNDSLKASRDTTGSHSSTFASIDTERGFFCPRALRVHGQRNHYYIKPRMHQQPHHWNDRDQPRGWPCDNGSPSHTPNSRPPPMPYNIDQRGGGRAQQESISICGTASFKESFDTPPPEPSASRQGNKTSSRSLTQRDRRHKRRRGEA